MKKRFGWIKNKWRRNIKVRTPKRGKTVTKKKDVNQNMQEELKPRTKNHAIYIRTIAENDITMCLGPAGSSKSYTSVGLGCQYLLEGRFDKLIIARPAVEALGQGTRAKGLGYLPGNVDEKLSQYVLPSVELMKRFLGKDLYYKFFHEEKIQFKALEYCRGLTFDNSYIIGEEFQSCSKEQIIMFVTRIGSFSKMVLSGDVAQSDISRSNSEFTTDFEYIVDKIKKSNIDGFGIMELNESDIVRNKLIGPFLKLF